jgi:hypothetical protein
MTKPDIKDMKRFIRLSAKPWIRTRVSEKQKQYSKFMSTEFFGNDEMICTVDRVMMSCELWWIHNNATKNFEPRHIFEVLSIFFENVNYNGRNSDGEHPLIPREYLRRFLEHSTTGKDGKETFSMKYCKMFRKAVQAQHTWIFEIFLHSSRYANSALHNFVIDEVKLRYCPVFNCSYCDAISRDEIFGLRLHR